MTAIRAAEEFTLVGPAEFETVGIDIAGPCNLRCVYCFQSNPEFVPHGGMPKSILDRALEFAKVYGQNGVFVTPQGELTFMPDWMEQWGRILDSGVCLGAVTNLAKPLSRDEAKFLFRFRLLVVSVDTADPEILKRVRRKVSLRDIGYNIALIRAVAAEEARQPPQFSLYCDYTDANAGRIVELAGLCVSLNCGLTIGAFTSMNYGLNGATFSSSGIRNVDDEGKPVFGAHQHTGEVVPCCGGHPPIGNIVRDSADMIANGPAVRVLRHSLLLGEGLPEACQVCPTAAIGDPATMQQMARDREQCFLSPRAPDQSQRAGLVN